MGGEIPLKIVTGIIARVEFKPFGLILKFVPELQKPPYIHLNITSEISEVEASAQIEGMPIISKKQIKTQIFAKLNEMIAIGGMVRATQSQFTDEIPGLGSIPILGGLFRSEDFKRLKSEAYIFIIPKRMEQGWLPSPEL